MNKWKHIFQGQVQHRPTCSYVIKETPKGTFDWMVFYTIVNSHFIQIERLFTCTNRGWMRTLLLVSFVSLTPAFRRSRVLGAESPPHMSANLPLLLGEHHVIDVSALLRIKTNSIHTGRRINHKGPGCSGPNHANSMIWPGASGMRTEGLKDPCGNRERSVSWRGKNNPHSLLVHIHEPEYNCFFKRKQNYCKWFTLNIHVFVH